ncbi:uncharacterized protein ATC70_007886 [Mucor velutinosus]|uniref:Uncharacterized protein n=1 Tax=Mucor velutinosus TaxID=708070 RepID=A0AAN7D4J6_9FUNG|nr:hypothetical protein ATC70_007886 [Mucor velutinosus]
MASSTKDHNVRDPASSTDGTGTDSRHNPQNSSFTSQSWADMAKQQERSSFNITPTIDSAFDETNVQSYFTQHQMSFNPQRKITLVWSNMGVVCKECHSDEHIKADCPVVRARKIKLQSSPEASNGADGHQRQFNKDRSLNPGFRSRLGRAIKSPDRL